MTAATAAADNESLLEWQALREHQQHRQQQLVVAKITRTQTHIYTDRYTQTNTNKPARTQTHTHTLTHADQASSANTSISRSSFYERTCLRKRSSPLSQPVSRCWAQTTPGPRSHLERKFSKTRSKLVVICRLTSKLHLGGSFAPKLFHSRHELQTTICQIEEFLKRLFFLSAKTPRRFL